MRTYEGGVAGTRPGIVGLGYLQYMWGAMVDLFQKPPGAASDHGGSPRLICRQGRTWGIGGLCRVRISSSPRSPCSRNQTVVGVADSKGEGGGVDVWWFHKIEGNFLTWRECRGRAGKRKRAKCTNRGLGGPEITTIGSHDLVGIGEKKIM